MKRWMGWQTAAPTLAAVAIGVGVAVLPGMPASARQDAGGSAEPPGLAPAQVAGRVTLAGRPVSLVLAAGGARAYVGIAGTKTTPNLVQAVDLTTNTVAGQVTLAGVPGDLVAGADGQTLYVLEQRGNVTGDAGVAAVSTRTMTVTGRALLSPSAYFPQATGLSLSADGLELLVAGNSRGMVTVPVAGLGGALAPVGLGRTARSLTASSALRAAPGLAGVTAVAQQPSASGAVVLTGSGKGLTVVNPGTGQTVGAVGLSEPASRVAASPDQRYAFAVGPANGNLLVVDVGRRTVTSTVPLGKMPDSLAVSADGGAVYVANRLSNSVSVVTRAQNGSYTVSQTLTVDGTPSVLALSPDGKKLYVGSAATNTLSVIAR